MQLELAKAKLLPLPPLLARFFTYGTGTAHHRTKRQHRNISQQMDSVVCTRVREILKEIQDSS